MRRVALVAVFAAAIACEPDQPRRVVSGTRCGPASCAGCCRADGQWTASARPPAHTR